MKYEVRSAKCEVKPRTHPSPLAAPAPPTSYFELRTSNFPASHFHAFTLLELLVAILIIGVLVSLTFAGLARSRQVAKTTVCASNERQMGQLIQAYVIEFNGVMPVMYNRALVADPQPALDTVLIDRGARNEVMKCPMDDKQVYEGSGTSYYWNFTVNGQRLDNVFSILGGKDQHRIPLISDKEGWHPELDNRVNILYADSHVDKDLIFSMSLP